MRLACTGAFRARWTQQIHDEWIRNLLANRPDLTRAQLELTATRMNAAVDDALVAGYEPLIDGIQGLPDADDRHVVASAIRCGASVIVTYNLKDFPESSLARWGLEAQHPDEFAENVFDLQRGQFLGALHGMRRALKSPPLSVEEFLDVLRRAGLKQLVKRLGGYKSVL